MHNHVFRANLRGPHIHFVELIPSNAWQMPVADGFVWRISSQRGRRWVRLARLIALSFVPRYRPLQYLLSLEELPSSAAMRTSRGYD
jgi:hypothetical protein